MPGLPVYPLFRWQQLFSITHPVLHPYGRIIFKGRRIWKEKDMEVICEMIDAVLKRPGDISFMDSTRARVREMCKSFPFYSRIYDI